MRLVVDTGCTHDKNWTWRQAIDYFLAHVATTEYHATSEGGRYISWPGQALAYKIGELKRKPLRQRAEKELGSGFAVRECHDAVLLDSSLPLSVLEKQVNVGIDRKKIEERSWTQRGPMPETATLLVSCPDQKGLVSGISSFIFRQGGNILQSDQYTDIEAGIFLARFEFDLDGFLTPRDQIADRFRPLAQEFGMKFEVHFSDHIPRIALFASRLLHCLEDLLQRQRAGEFKAEIALVISNHPDADQIASRYGVAFEHFPIRADNKRQQEAEEMRELKSRGVELIVLARYMQVLSEDFITAYPNRVINIHHSFLPAFVGAKPYHQAFLCGVKLIGATGHYVTMNLDEGPIIEQEVVRVSHRDSIEDMLRKGRDLERNVLGRAVRLHLVHRVLTYGNKTVVFD